MKTVKSHAWLRNFLITVCALFGCLLFALGIALPKSVFAEGEGGTAAAGQYELTKVELSLREGYVFTSDLSDEQKINLVEASVTFTEKVDPPAEGEEAVEPKTFTEKLTLTGSGLTRTADKSDTVDSVAFAVDSANNQITATVTLKAGYTAAAEIEGGTLAMTYGTKQVNGISATYNGTGNYKMTSDLNNPSDFTVVWAYDNGTVGTTPEETLVNDCYQFGTANLFPDSFKNITGTTYDKDVVIVLNDKGAALDNAHGNKYETTAKVTGIAVEPPTSLAASIVGSLKPHPARSENLDLEGLTVNVTFGEGKNSKTLTVPLTSFNEGIKVTYYDEHDVAPEEQILTTAITYCEIELTYPGTNMKATGWPSITVTPISIPAPTFPDNTKALSYYNGVNIDITGLDFSDRFPNDPPQIDPVVTTTSDKENAFTAGEITNGVFNIGFNQPGQKYTITLTLLDNEGQKGGDFQWQNPAFAIVKDAYTLEYTVQVEKGTYDLTLAGPFEWTYGDADEKGTVTGDLQGSEKIENDSFTFSTAAPADNTLSYYLEYSSGSSWTTTIPKNAGKYSVRAVSYVTEFYKSSTSGALPLTISPKQLNAQDYVKTGIIYDKDKSYSANEILSTNQYGGDTLSITVAAGEGTAFPIKYYKTGGHGVVLTLGNTNYTFKALPGTWSSVGDESVAACRTDNAVFTVGKRVIKYQITQNSFYYGDPTGITVGTETPGDEAGYLGMPNVNYTNTTTGAFYTSRENINQWDAGKYKVTYRPIYKADMSDEEKASLDISSKTEVEFEVYKAEINKTALTDLSQEYLAVGNEFSVTASETIQNGGYGKYNQLSEVRKIRVTGESGTEYDTGLSVSETKFKITRGVDEYTVTIYLADTVNFKWVGEDQTDPVATWTITKRLLDKVALSGSVDTITYDHNDHAIGTRNYDAELMTYLISDGTTNYSLDETNAVTLKNAGVYTFTFTLSDSKNYAWNDGYGDAAEENACSFSFTVNKATAALAATDGEARYDDDETKKPFFAVPEAKKTQSTEALAGALLAFTFEVKKQGDNTVVATDQNAATTKVQASGTYIYTVTGLTGSERGNYELPEGGLTFTFVVKSQDLNVPVFDTSKPLTYNGEEQSILGFIKNYGTENYGDRIIITIKKGDTVVATGADPKVKTVYLVDGAVAEYSVTVAPNANYKWNTANSADETKEYSFTFTVTQYSVIVVWETETLTSVYGDFKTPVPQLNTYSADDVSITIGYKQGSDNNVTPKNAGEYFVYATGLAGDDKDNYKLGINLDTKYVITKKKIVKPELNGCTAAFGTSETGSLYKNGNPDPAGTLLEASVTGYRPADWFDDKTQRNLSLGSETYFEITTGKFFYKSAGRYTIVFTIKDGANYCWSTSDDKAFGVSQYDLTYADFAEVTRTVLTAPAFGTTEVNGQSIHIRAQEWETFDADKLVIPTTIDGLSVDVTYGKRSLVNGEYVYDTATAGVKGGTAQTDVGQYYAYVNLVASENVDIYNYVWGVSADFDNGPVGFVIGTDTRSYSYTSGEVSIKVHYAITSTQLLLNFENVVYTFGDNGIVDGTTLYSDLFSVLNLKDDGSLSRLTAPGTGMSWNRDSISFVEEETKFVDSNGHELTADDLENGLPWNAGTYKLSFEIKYKNENYQNLPVSDLSVTVNKRAVELSWTNLSKVYNGTAELGTDKVATVQMNNVPKRANGDAITLPTLTVSARGGEAKNFGDYTLYISGFSGENKDNFTYTGAKNSYGDVTESLDDVPFTVTKYAFTATANGGISYTYGDAIPNDQWTAGGDTEANRPATFTEDVKKIVLKVMSGSTVVSKPVVGETYKIIPAWGTDDANYDVTWADADFTVLTRNITVELTANDKQTLSGSVLTSKYYADSTNYGTSNYSFVAKYKGSENGAIVSGDSVPFALRSAVTRASVTGEYPITVAVTDKNYTVTVGTLTGYGNATATETGCVHKIVDAQILPDYATRTDEDYRATQYAYLSKNTATGSTGGDMKANNLTYFIFPASAGATVPQESTDGWAEYDSSVHYGMAAGDYYFFIKVTADNHETVILDNGGAPFCLHIAKAKLTDVNGINNGQVRYDALAHTYLTDGRRVSGVSVSGTSAANVPQWFIGSVNSDAATTDDVANWAPYDKTAHAVTDVETRYFFVKITASNHDDLIVKAENGKPFALEITKAPLTLSASMSIFFNEANPVDAKYYMDGDAVTVQKLIDGYNKVFTLTGWKESDETKFTGGTLEGLTGSFTYAIDGYVQGTSGVPAGDGYRITLNAAGLSSRNYTFAVANGLLDVKPLPVSASIKADSVRTAVYGETGLAMPEATVIPEQESTYGAGKISLEGFPVNRIVTVSTDALRQLASGEGYTTNDVGEYDILLTFDRNFKLIEDGYKTVKYSVTQAKNKITTENYKLFQGAYSWTGDKPADAVAAWVYGKFNDDGYRPDGKNKLTAFDLLSRDDVLKITLAFTLEGKEWTKEITVASTGENIESKLIELFGGVASFGAGSYTVTYHMNATKNYEAYDEVWNFFVDKKAVTVTPSEVGVIYGDDVDAENFLAENSYKYTNTALDGYGESEESIADIISFYFGTVKEGSRANYEKGWNFGTYALKAVIDGSFVDYADNRTAETDNYVFTFEKSDFKVTARTVTLTVRDATNHFMFVGAYNSATQKYALEEQAELTYALKTGSKDFFDGCPFTLQTAAIVSHSETAGETKNFGKYAIYAVFNDDIAKSNYNIVIENDFYDASVDTGTKEGTQADLVILKDGKIAGGVFTVTPAVLHAEMKGPYYEDPDGTVNPDGSTIEVNGQKYTLYTSNEGTTYDGKFKYYFATTNVDREDVKALVPTFTPVYSKVGDASFTGIPKDRGEYRVTFTPDNNNKNFADLSIASGTVYIYARQLSIGANLTGGSVQGNNAAKYDGNPYTLALTFDTVIGDEVLLLDVTVNGKTADDATRDERFEILKPSAGATRNVLKINVTRALGYEISVRLAAGMENYSLPNGAYKHTLTVNKADLYIFIQNAEIEYGTALTPNDFFNVAYSLVNNRVTTTEPTLLSLIRSNENYGYLTSSNQYRYVNSGLGAAAGAAYSDGTNGAASKAGWKFDVGIDNISSSNWTVHVDNGELTVTPRAIRLNVYGVADNNAQRNIAHNTYDGNHHDGANGAFEKNYTENKTKYLELASGSSFGNSKMTIANLDVTLSIDSAINAGYYPITAKNNDNNFAITFLYGGTAFSPTNRPRYQIDHKELIAKVQAAGTSYEAAPSTIYVVYGDEAVQSLFTVCYSGWVPGQESTGRGSDVTIGNAGATYKAYQSNVGDTFAVNVNSALSGLKEGTETYANYDLKLVGATLAVKPRPITASIDEKMDRTFRPDPSDYHDGEWGLPVEAQIAFGNVDLQSRLAGGYTLSYNTEADGKGQTKGTAPVKFKEGGYAVTVLLGKNVNGKYNYTFSETDETVQSHTLDYSILKKQVNLVWNLQAVYEATTVYLTGGFVADVMDVKSFTVGQQAVSGGDYSATNDGLNIAVDSINGTYTITVVLKATATNNWELIENVEGSMKKVDERVAVFTYAADKNLATKIVFVTDDMGTWTYGDEARAPHAQVRLLTDDTLVSNAVVIFDYVPVTVPAGTEPDSVVEPADGWYDNTRWTATVNNAGKYLVRARYTGSTTYHAANPVYYYFEIARKKLDKPTIKDADSYVYAERDGAGYIVGEIENYDSAAMQVARSAVQASYENGAMKLYATAKGDYAVRVALVDKVNYAWKDDTTDDVNLTWQIRPATDNTLVWNDQRSTAVYAEQYDITANSVKYQNNVLIVYSFTPRTEGEDAPAANVRWENGFPVNAGKYWIRATGSSPEGNFNENSIDRAFEITKVNLTLTPTGAMTYGQTFDGTQSGGMNDFEIIESGLVNGDTAQMVRRDIRNVSYSVSNPETGLWSAGSHYILTVSAEATNYNILSGEGTFTVAKARLSVTVGNNASSLYKQAPRFGEATLSLSGVVSGDDRNALTAALKALFVCEATNTSDAGTYEIGLSVTEIDNYTLAVTKGVYTINRLPVTVAANWGGYDYGAENKVLPSVTSVSYNGTALTLTADELKDFRFIYADSSSNPYEAPTAAGEHIVSVYIEDTSNYVLASPVSGRFVIRQTELDAELIEWEIVYYDTVIKKPEVSGIRGNAFSKDAFTVEYLGDWNRAGVAYTIRLTLTRPESTKWKTVEGAVRTLTYTVSRGQNTLVDPLKIDGWTFGGYSEDANLPEAAAKFGTVYFEYSDNAESGYTTAAPVNGNVGAYWVRAVVEGTPDYERFESDPVRFEITKKAISAPALNVITEGYGQNNVYTGVAMQAEVTGYDSTLMYIRYDDGTMIVNGNNIKVVATNAGTYHVAVTLVQGDNYAWADGTELDESGNARLTWTIGRKKVAKPTHNDATLIVNGTELAYYPIGFDASIMSIEKNTSSYGGTFTAVIKLIDTDNYEWADDGSTESFSLEWYVVGADTVFIVVISILSALAVAAGVAGGVEGYFYYKKKKEEQNKAQNGDNAKEGV